MLKIPGIGVMVYGVNFVNGCNRMERIFSGVLFLFLLAASVAGAERSFHVLVADIWSGQPVSAAMLIMQGDTLHSNDAGIVRISGDCASGAVGLLQAPGYFKEKVKCRDLKNGIVYLTPVNQTPFITVVRSRISSQPLNIPSHQTHLTVQSQNVVAESIADLLEGQSGVFVKSYGPVGALKTIAMRGMAAEQTQVLFDGIPLNNLQLGSADLSQFTVDDLSGIDLYRGSNVILGGSGSIGGSLNLNPLQPADRLKIQSRAGYSSLKNKQAGLRIHLPWNALHLRTLFTFAHANGLNRYSTQYFGQKVPLRDRDFRQNHLSYQMIFAPSILGQFKFFISHFKRAAGAPRAFVNPGTETSNRARINSDNTLTYLRWQHEQEKSGYYAQIYARNEWMTYFDPSLLINLKPLHSIHFNKEQGLQARFHFSPRQALLLKSGVELANQAIVSSEAGRHKRQRQAFYLLADGIVFENPDALQAFHLNGGLRIEHYDRQSPVLLPALGADFSYGHTQIYANAGRNFRMPGFNDLYWVPGGNPDLKPELSRNLEIGARQILPARQWLGQFEISAYQNTVRDQIRWLPGSNGYWTPKNISKVRSRGIEIDARWAHVNGLHKIRFSYTFGKAVKKAAESANDRTIGNQVPFLPQEQWSLSAQTGWRLWRIGTSIRHTGFRFTDFSNDPNAILHSFTTVRFWLQGEVSTGAVRIRPQLSLDNAFNRDYEILKGFPMPGRFWQLGCAFEFVGQESAGR